ncbi:MAG TPA: hypothetical protein PKE46_09170 [Micropruina sp.]|nr:hypothetical protein [Propionibacterium sp.]HMQ36340.1 hypothetical protein [Micropruina sp.]HMR22292.1 hypothetical protein [Micropruina sp.]
MPSFRLDTPYLIIGGCLLLVLLTHGWLIKRRTPWLGAVVPALYLGGIGYLAATGRLGSVVDYLFAAFGLVGLLLWWSSSRRAMAPEGSAHVR